MLVLRLLLFPITILYALVIFIRNGLYKTGVLNRTKFDFPIVCVGNIAVGGTGKTPHIEWLIRALQTEFQLAVLSRGYKRKTSGYILANNQSSPSDIGDEPFQIKQKFSGIDVAVSENRVLGVPALLGDKPETQLILMDDGFQHLPINPGYSIILTDYQNPFYNDWLMPSGTLREFRSAYKRAQCIIVSKCPVDLTSQQQAAIIKHIRPLPHQLVLFSSIQYGTLQPLFESTVSVAPTTEVLIVSGIARNELFVNEVKKSFPTVNVVTYSDHKEYTPKVLADIAARFEQIDAEHKMIITTEKDAVKLQSEEARNILGHLPVYFLPIEISFTHQSGELLLEQIRAHVQRMNAEDEEHL